MGLLDRLWDNAIEQSKSFPDEDFLIKGLWKVGLLFKPNAAERTFSYTFLIALTTGQGCCYCSTHDVELDKDIMGTDARQCRHLARSSQIAILDSIYSTFPSHPHATHNLDGLPSDKAGKRAAIVADETIYQLEQMPGNRNTVVQVGVVGNVVKELHQRGLNVLASDFDPRLVGQDINGVEVQHGSRTLELVEQADIVVATGMTLGTQTLEDIMKAAHASGTKVLLFAETGANFGQFYCRNGIDAVVSEYFPFYIFQGRSRLDVFRADEST